MSGKKQTTPVPPLARRSGSVAMFHVGRCGSTVLAQQLAQHPDVAWTGELFRGDLLLGVAETRTDEGIWPWKASPYFPHAPYLYISEQMNRAPAQAVFGFETKFYHPRLSGLTQAGYLATLKRMGFEHFVLLTRKNILRKVVSSLIAAQAHLWHLKAGKVARKRTLTLDVTQVGIELQHRTLLQTLQDIDREAGEFRELLAGDSALELTYEDHIERDPSTAYAAVCDFLSLRPASAKIQSSRTNPFSLDDLLSNVDEVRRHLRGTPYAWMAER